ncbi:hypothetical protein L249_0855 [Ophiocordyceps polyrhachis-furcata BCC 54312]|uniref:Uncharacterized protein n=1 Tax=Ophiocordyceps polyrhachis-furcata BCC 54312 TaxID=1330021 RepID=A0A367LFK2_9HYPO|nr:hypothetical protein L249_0855 [Ophiocordyceps polyrhachis-furcata BCC 54312]
MAIHPTDVATQGMDVHGLRFLNDEWNDSISNGEVFTVRWNQSLTKVGSGLGVFQVTYPKDGVVVYELVSNLTDAIENDGATCKWMPQNLEKKNVYAMWLTSADALHPNWTLSPPWVPKEAPNGHDGSKSGSQGTPWAAPFLIPVVCLLGLYALSLTGYLVYRRRKKTKMEKSLASPDSSRHCNFVNLPISSQALNGDEARLDKPVVVGMVNTDHVVDGDGLDRLAGITCPRATHIDYDEDDDEDDSHRSTARSRGIRIVTNSGPRSEAEERLLVTPVLSAGSTVSSSTQQTPVGRNFSRPVQIPRNFA